MERLGLNHLEHLRGFVKPFPASLMGLGEIKHSFTAPSNPPCPASASSRHLLEEGLKAIAWLKFWALHAVLSKHSPSCLI